MTRSVLRCPRAPRQLLDDEFLENRSRLLEVAAFLDRIDRAAGSEPVDDFRLRAFATALHTLQNVTYPRVDALQMVFSDPGTGTQPAGRRNGFGAFRPGNEEVG